MKNLVKQLKNTFNSWKTQNIKEPIWKDFGTTWTCENHNFLLVVEDKTQLDEFNCKNVNYRGTLFLQPKNPKNSFRYERDFDSLEEAKEELLNLSERYKNSFRNL